jgi:hypothetical protein
MIEKGNNINKINFVFKNSNDNKEFDEKIKNYQAFCCFELIEPCDIILDTVDYIKDNNKKKPVKSPDFRNELKVSRFFQRVPDHNILIYDKNGEFIIRNKILECCIRAIQNEIEPKIIYKSFNELYDEYTSKCTSKIENLIQTYSFKAVEF